MRNVMTLMLCFFTFTGIAQPQEKEKLTTEERAEILTEWMNEELELGEDQIPRVKEINLEFSKGMEEVMATDGFRSKMSKFRTHGNKRDKALEAVLTKEQYKEFMDIKGNMRKEMKERAKNRKKA